MKRHMCVLALALAVAISGSESAQAQIGGFSLPGTKKPAAAGAVDPDTYLKNARDAEGLMSTSLDQMSSVVLAKEQMANIEALKKQAAETTDPKEKEALQQQVASSEAADLNQVDYDKYASDQEQKLSAQQKQNLAASSFNFLLAVLKDQQLSGQSKGVMDSLSGNPTALSKLGAVKDSAASIGSQLQMSSSLAGKMPKVFSAVGVKDVPKVSDAPKPVTGD
jgi:hypothetical protein